MSTKLMAQTVSAMETQRLPEGTMSKDGLSLNKVEGI